MLTSDSPKFGSFFCFIECQFINLLFIIKKLLYRILYENYFNERHSGAWAQRGN